MENIQWENIYKQYGEYSVRKYIKTVWGIFSEKIYKNNMGNVQWENI